MATFNSVEYDNSMLSMKKTFVNPLTCQPEGLVQWVRTDLTAPAPSLYKTEGTITILL